MDNDLIPFSPEREVIVDAGYLAARRHIVHGLVEVDVTRAREALKRSVGQDGRPLSFTAFIIASLGRAVQLHPHVQAYRDLRRRMVVFHDVDVSFLLESRPGAVAMPFIIRAANRKSLRAISDEIRTAQAAPRPTQKSGGLVRLAPRLPRFVRLWFIRAMRLNPQWIKQFQGTVVVTSVGMFGKHAGWGIAFLMSHNLGLTVGGIGKKPVLVDGALAEHEFLSLTISFDHDVVDGAPAARFTQSLVEIIETAAVCEAEPGT